MSNCYTHKRRSRLARCLVWSGDNTDDILSMLNVGHITAELSGPRHIMVRYGRQSDAIANGRSIETLEPGWAVAVRENGDVICYDPVTFATKYEQLEEPIPITY